MSGGYDVGDMEGSLVCSPQQRRSALGVYGGLEDNKETLTQAKNGRIWRCSNVEVTEVESADCCSWTGGSVKFIAKVDSLSAAGQVD